MKTTAVIMAGGKGERFWPQSRAHMPKQFISLTSDKKTMIQLTCERLEGIVEKEDIFVVTNESYESLVVEQLPWLPKANILLEPAARNTAPCIGLAATVILKRYGNAVMIVLPSDHMINQRAIYADVLRKCVAITSVRDNLLTIGITPSYPETGYGYIQYCKDERSKDIVDAYSVARFVEKPDADTAKNYIASGDYLWNSGMFVFTAKCLLKHFEKHLPEHYTALSEIHNDVGKSEFSKTLKEKFLTMKPISIDYGIMEKSDDILTMPASFGWDDVGSWNALERIQKTNEYGNVVIGDIVTVNCKDDIISGGKRLIAVVGMQDTVIVDTNDVLLVCNKAETGSIKKILEALRTCNRNDVL